jgi:hypothetical protein
MAALARMARWLWRWLRGETETAALSRLKYYVEWSIYCSADTPWWELLTLDKLWLDVSWASLFADWSEAGSERMSKEGLEALVRRRKELPVRWRHTGVPLGVLRNLRVQQVDDGGYELFGELSVDRAFY